MGSCDGGSKENFLGLDMFVPKPRNCSFKFVYCLCGERVSKIEVPPNSIDATVAAYLSEGPSGLLLSCPIGAIMGWGGGRGAK